jgi:hypothetical protein
MIADGTAPRTLIAGSSYIATEERAREVFLWSRVNRRLNPDCDTLLVDSASPINITRELYDVNTVMREHENVGHANGGGADGWGRDLTTIIDYAISRSYDWLVFIESDLIFTRPVAPIIDKLRRIGCLAAAPMTPQYQFIETGLMFLSVPYLAVSRFAALYDWRATNADEIVERKVERLLADELLCLPLRGIRNEINFATRENFSTAFRYGCDYLTHCEDFELYNLALAAANIDLKG